MTVNELIRLLNIAVKSGRGNFTIQGKYEYMGELFDII